ncbi:hypothetical protein H5410_006665 [Solanum commersonii]|uniref:Uncharacterized protein n=1 Tax=Solanum commersonii TaxID=4109 RepID=A0A9J6ABZ8_SOLCO|nr:hypothetical protein H5410_006665 [Solanum commersonii]
MSSTQAFIRMNNKKIRNYHKRMKKTIKLPNLRENWNSKNPGQSTPKLEQEARDWRIVTNLDHNYYITKFYKRKTCSEFYNKGLDSSTNTFYMSKGGIQISLSPKPEKISTSPILR